MGYSRRLMQRECEGELRLIRTALLSLFIAAIAVIWIAYAGRKEPTPRDILLFAGLPVAAGGVLWGLYLTLTRDEWLIRHSRYGQALKALGDAPALIKQIDEEAKTGRHIPHGALLHSFLILYLIDTASRRPGKAYALPIPAKNIRRLALSRDAEKGVWIAPMDDIQAFCRVRVEEAEEWEEILRWCEAQEIETTWSH